MMISKSFLKQSDPFFSICLVVTFFLPLFAFSAGPGHGSDFKRIFEFGPNAINSAPLVSLLNIRSHFYKKEKRERLVFDFETSELPKITVLNLGEEKRILLDIFKMVKKDTITSNDEDKYHFVKKINFFPLHDQYTSLEIVLKIIPQNIKVVLLPADERKISKLVFDIFENEN